MFLPDVNLWLALAFESHFHHAPAVKWFETAADGSSFFCRLTQQGLLRLATNPKAFGSEAISLKDAWKCFDALIGDPRVVFAEEPENLETFWRSYTQLGSFSPKLWNDAYLAAFAAASSVST